MLVLSKLHVNYGQEQVLQDINLSILPGEKVALIGPSGAGKTTLLRNLFQQGPHQAAFIHQNHALVSRLSVFHNVFSGRLDHHSLGYNLRNLILPMAREVKGVTSILASLGIEEKLYEKAGALSGGQMQRVAVARALYRAAPVLLGDEPVSSIDPKQAQQVLELLKNSAETVILSLHSVQLAMDSFERIIGLRKGRILFDLPARQVSQHQLEELFAP